MKNLFGFRGIATIVVILAVVFSFSSVNAASSYNSFPTEWGKLLPDLTKQFGRISKAVNVENGKLVFVTVASFVVEKGIVIVTDAKAEFTPMDISTINSEISAVLGTGPLRNLWVASTLTIAKGPNPYWNYSGYDGISQSSINGIDVMTRGLDIDSPFIASPKKGTKTDKYVISGKEMKIYLDGKIAFEAIF